MLDWYGQMGRAGQTAALVRLTAIDIDRDQHDLGHDAPTRAPCRSPWLVAWSRS